SNVRKTINIGHENPIKSVRSSPDGRFIASLDYGGDLIVSNTDGTIKTQALKDKNNITCFDFFPNSRAILYATGTWLLEWDITTNVTRKIFRNQNPVTHLRVSFDGSCIIMASKKD